MIATLFLRNRTFNYLVLNNKNIKLKITFGNEILYVLVIYI